MTSSLDRAKLAQVLAAQPARSLARVPFAVQLGVLAFAWFVAMAVRLPLDEDEGYYALAAELVAHGRLPYRDFFSPQMPLASLVLAPFAGLMPSFVFLRVVMAAFAGVAAALLAQLVLRESRSRVGAALATVLFTTHELSWRWLSTLRPYALGEACTLGALLLVTPRGRDPTRRELLLGGALAALAPLTRLPLAPTVGIVVLSVLLRGRSALVRRGALILGVVYFGASVVRYPLVVASTASLLACAIAVAGAGGREAAKRGAWLALGIAATALVVIAPFWLLAKENLIFGVIRYHGETSAMVGWPQSRRLLFASIGGGAITELSAMGAQNVILVVANLVALALSRGAIRIASLAGVLALAIGAARHQPAIEHYVTPIVPFLAIGAGVALGRLDRLARGRLRRQRVALYASVIAMYALVTGGSLHRAWHQGMSGEWDFSALRPAPSDRALGAIQGVVRAHGGPLLAPWAGSALGSASSMMPGFENQFARWAGDKHSAEERKRLHLVTESDLDAAVVARTPKVVVVDRQTGFGDKAVAYENLLVASRYAKVAAGAGYIIYARIDDAK